MILLTSVFGFKLKVSRFTSFLAWTGMITCVLMIIVSLALLTIPNDVKPFVEVLRKQLDVNDALPDDYDNTFKDIFNKMYGYGGYLMILSLPLLPMYYLLRKRNMKKDIEGVMKMLMIICYFTGGIEIVAFILTLPLYIVDLKEMIENKEVSNMWFSLITIFYHAASTFFIILMIHGIRTIQTKFVKGFIVFQYSVFVLVAVGDIIGSIYLSAIVSQFWIFLLGVMLMMFATFFWIFGMGPIITLNTILEEKERNGNNYLQMEQVNVV